MNRHFRIGCGLVCGLLSTLALAEQPMPSAEETRERGLVNWPAPLYWSPGAPKAGTPTLQSKDGFWPLPLIAVTPCRVVDTRVASMPPGYGPPSMGANEARTFQLAGQCGIGAFAQAVSLNITVTGGQGFGYIALYPAGGSAPVVSTLNFTAGQTVANAAIVPLGGGVLTVLSAGAGTDLIIDTNGYYAAAPVGGFNTFLGLASGNDAMAGDYNTGSGFGSLAVNAAGSNNTAAGAYALTANTDGSFNTAEGSFALYSNSTGDYNTAVGVSALLSNTTGVSNTAAGFHTLYTNVDGGFNTAIGQEALNLNSGGNGNTASGFQALVANVSGNLNSASGQQALYGNTSGSSNTAVGLEALYGNTTGNFNTAIGHGAGFNLTSGDNNLYVGNEGVATESNTMRLGSGTDHTRAFIAGVRGVTTGQNDAVPVMIDGLGQLGTVSSSARTKQDIADMADASTPLLELRPVTFRYNAHPDGAKQFGLIAEEVEKVLPELVVHGASGEAETVLYHELPAMLLNEIQKQQRLIECQIREIENLTARVAALEEGSSARP